MGGIYSGMVRNISGVINGMDAITLISVIASTLGVGTALAGTINRRLAKVEAKAEEKENTRAKEMILLLKGVKAAGSLSYAAAVAVKTGHANGEVEQGLKDYEAWDKELDTFLVEQSVKN